MKVIVWQLNFELAQAKGLASDKRHIEPFTGAMFGKTDKVKQLWDARCYEAVCMFDTQGEMKDADALGRAFSNTQNIDEAWWAAKAPGIELFHQTGYRSTSVGDVLELLDHAVDNRSGGQLYVVKPLGFAPMVL